MQNIYFQTLMFVEKKKSFLTPAKSPKQTYHLVQEKVNSFTDLNNTFHTSDPNDKEFARYANKFTLNTEPKKL